MVSTTCSALLYRREPFALTLPHPIASPAESSPVAVATPPTSAPATQPISAPATAPASQVCVSTTSVLANQLGRRGFDVSGSSLLDPLSLVRAFETMSLEEQLKTARLIQASEESVPVGKRPRVEDTDDDADRPGRLGVVIADAVRGLDSEARAEFDELIEARCLANVFRATVPTSK